jgi:hypothetical protein
MSETANFKPEQKKPVKLTNRGKAIVAGGLLAVGAAAGTLGHAKYMDIKEDHKMYDELTSGNVYEKYENGEIDRSKVIKIVINQEQAGVPWNVATNINANKHGAVQELSDIISHQVGEDGAQIGETAFVPREDVDHKIVESLEQPK